MKVIGKKILYVAVFSVLGFVFQLAAHAVIETGYITLLISNYGVFGLGLSWDTWFVIHKVFTFIFTLGGLVAGVWQGLYWWPKLYDPISGKRHHQLDI